MPTSDPCFAVGTTATYQTYDATGALTGTPIKFTRLRGFSVNTKSRTVADVSDIEDEEIRRRPVRRDPGTLTLTLGLTNQDKADNQYIKLDKLLIDGTMLRIVVNLPGTFDDAGTTPNVAGDILKFDGFFSSIGTPDIAVGNDEMLTYTAEFQRTNL